MMKHLFSRHSSHTAHRSAARLLILLLLILPTLLTVAAVLAADSFVKLANPDSLPSSQANGVAFSADGTYMAAATQGSPYIAIYKRSGVTFTKLSSPDTLPPYYGYGVSFSPDGTYLAVAHAGDPFITIYKRSGDTFTKLSNPSTLPVMFAHGVSFSPDSTYLAVAHEQSPYVTIYKRSGDTFTKLSNPETLPGSDSYGVSFSPDGSYLAIAHASSPRITIYKHSGDTFTKLSNPATLPTGNGKGVSFSSESNYLAVAHASSPYITIYKRSGDTFTKLSNPATLPPNDASGVCFSPDSSYLSVSHGSPPNMTIYKRSSDTFSKLDDPATLPPGTSLSTAFSPDSNYVAFGHWNSPYVSIYKFTAAPTVVSAATDTSGAVITITFTKSMADPAGKQGEFSYSVNGGTAQTFSAAALNADTTKIDLTCFGAAITGGDSVTVSYTKGTVLAEDSGVLDSFSNQTVSNNMPGAPVFVSAATSIDGSLISITFNKAMDDPTGKQAEFSYSVNGGAAQPFSSAALDADTTKIDLVCSGTAIAYGNTVTVSYTKGTVTAEDCGILESFSNQPVTNNIRNSTKAITSFKFSELRPQVTGTISEGAHTIALTVPAGTKVNALAPAINITGASVSPASGAANNFTLPRTYTVTAADGSTQAYIVTVTVTRDTSVGTGLSTPHGSGTAGTTSTPTQTPTPIPNLNVQSASLSTGKVAPGEQVTVTANVVNSGTGNGSSMVKVYVNGSEEASRGVAVNSGGSSTVTFNVSRSEPGTYEVYVDSKPAGSFTVDQFSDPNAILYISGALVLFALGGTVIWMGRRRGQG